MKLKIACCLLLLTSCTTNTVKIINEKQGKLKSLVKLEIREEKKFLLDDNTAPNLEYTQMYRTIAGERYFTFINNYTNTIYCYDYNTMAYLKKISWEKTGSEAVVKLKAYHIKSFDSIYLYNTHPFEIILSNNKSTILHKVSLMMNNRDLKWTRHYPQYLPQTVMPFLETSHDLLLNGFYFGIIPESIISEFKFTLNLNFKTNQLKFTNTYPRSLYGYNHNWHAEMYTFVYSDLLPNGKLVLSFPVSHDLYVTDSDAKEYKKIYAGSNYASTICSINKPSQSTSNDDMFSSFMRNDEYTAIKYDKFRKVFYRFFLNALPKATIQTNYKEKSVTVIIMDESFQYLGETTIGKWKTWNWQNSFVTEEGLNIEYIEDKTEEKYLTLKIFTVKKI